jgi:catechol 2,3-dioxygenase-like lactoylglutathione lyase family enzyme
MMVTSYGHTSFTVSDIDKSIDFYVDQLGLKLTRRWERVGPEIETLTGVDGARLSMALVECEGFKLELIQYVGGAGLVLDPVINNVGAAHIGFEVPDVDAFCERLVSNGVKLYGRPATLQPPRVRGVYISDPDGITIELSEPRID